MNKYIPFIIGGVLLIGLIVFFAQNQSRYYNWSQEFAEGGKKPYDLKVLYGILDSHFDVEKFDKRVEEELSRDSAKAKGTTYLYIGTAPKYTEDEAWHLKQYVMAGGEAFIFTDRVPDSLSQYLFYPEDCGSMTDWMGANHVKYSERIHTTFTHPSIDDHYYEFDYVYNNYPRTNRWHYIPDGAICDNERREYDIAALGHFIDKKKRYINFIRVQVGEGYFYFHTNPIMFTNFYLVDTAGAEYTNYVFAHASNKKLYWDKQSAVSAKETDKIASNRPAVPAQSPLEYIFSQEPLRWSWFMFLALALIYVFFRSKRKQRRIPILATNRNTSLAFVETIGALYFQQQDHKGIIKKQMHLFLSYLRQRYHLVTKDLDDKLINRIVVRARIDKGIVQDIFNQYFRLRKSLRNPHATISAEQLNNFYLLIERFHQAEKQNRFDKKSEE